MAKEMEPVFSAQDLTELPSYHIYLKLMIDGKVSQAFSGETLPAPTITESYEEMIRRVGRERYGW